MSGRDSIANCDDRRCAYNIHSLSIGCDNRARGHGTADGGPGDGIDELDDSGGSDRRLGGGCLNQSRVGSCQGRGCCDLGGIVQVRRYSCCRRSWVVRVGRGDGVGVCDSAGRCGRGDGHVGHGSRGACLSSPTSVSGIGEGDERVRDRGSCELGGTTQVAVGGLRINGRDSGRKECGEVNE